MKKRNEIAEGNAFTLCIKQAVWNVSDGKIEAIQASKLSGVKLMIGSPLSKSQITTYVKDNEIRADIPATTKRGDYSAWITATYENRAVSANIQEAFHITAWSREDAFADREVYTQDAVYLYGGDLTDAQIIALKAELNAKIAAAEAAATQANAKKAEAEGVAYNAAHNLTASAIKTAVEEAVEETGVSVDLSPVTTLLNNPNYGLAAIKAACGGGSSAGVTKAEMDAALATLKASLQGDSAQATLTALKGLIESVASSALSASDKADIIAAMPNVSTLAHENTAEAARVASVAAKNAAEAISVPSVSDIQNGLAKSSEIGQLRQEVGDFGSSNAAAEIANISQELGNLSAIFSGITAQDITDEYNAE